MQAWPSSGGGDDAGGDDDGGGSSQALGLPMEEQYNLFCNKKYSNLLCNCRLVHSMVANLILHFLPSSALLPRPSSGLSVF